MEQKHSFKNLEIGTAEYTEGPTGCTVFHFPQGALGAVDIRGGAAAVRESSSLASSNSFGSLDALVFAGGSTYGLEAADGVASELLKLCGNKVDFMNIPAVPAAIVYDFAQRDNSIYPDKDLGIKAFKNKVPGIVSSGRVGAGANVSVGKYLGRKYSEKSGQAVGHFKMNGLEILTLTILNAVGNILDHQGAVIAGTLMEDQKRHHIADVLVKTKFQKPESIPKGNTTITAVIINAKIPRDQLERLAIMAHTSMGKMIEPFHTPDDGDVLFAISTQEVELEKGIEISDLGVLASRTIQNSIVDLFKS